MSGSKMETTKQALILFLKSLPRNSMFEVIGFGSTYNLLSERYDENNKFEKDVGFRYSDESVSYACE